MTPRAFRIRPLAHLPCLIGLIAGIPVRAGAQEDPLAAVAGTEVRVSRQEATVTFPVDRADWWGWSPAREGKGAYVWRLSMNDKGAPRDITLRIEPQPIRIYRTLRALVSGDRALVCRPHPYCGGTQVQVRTSVSDGRLVLTIRDSAAIAELFGLRPEVATAYRSGPDMPGEAQTPVRVTYVDPQLPPPDSAIRAAAAERRDRHFASINRTARMIVVERPHADLWLVAGDSASVHVRQSRCTEGNCLITSPLFPQARWSVADSSIARIRPAGERSVQVLALRPGRTVLRVTGLGSPSDTMLRFNPFPAEVEREVVVTGPVTAVRICPRWPIRPGAPFPLHVEVTDSANNVFRDPPVGIKMGSFTLEPSDTAGVLFHGSGASTLTVEYADKADTLRLRVIPGRRPPNLHEGNESERCNPSALTSALPAARRPDD